MRWKIENWLFLWKISLWSSQLPFDWTCIFVWHYDSCNEISYQLKSFSFFWQEGASLLQIIMDSSFDYSWLQIFSIEWHSLHFQYFVFVAYMEQSYREREHSSHYWRLLATKNTADDSDSQTWCNACLYRRALSGADSYFYIRV